MLYTYRKAWRQEEMWGKRRRAVVLGGLVLAIAGGSSEAFLRLPTSRPVRLERQALSWRLQSSLKDAEETQLAVKALTFPGSNTSTIAASSSDSIFPPVPEVEDDMSFFAKIWYNCNAFTKSCLGNALDDPNYRNGVLASIALTLIFSSQHPALHSVYTNIQHSPPVPLLNAGAATAAAIGMLFAGDTLQALAPCKVKSSGAASPERRDQAIRAGMELGLWKTIAACVNLLGLSSTSASHGAFLIQLTTLIVPLVQGVMGIPIPKQIWAGVTLAMAGLYLFTNDATSATQSNLQGDIFCILSAVFYSAYDLRIFQFGKELGDTPSELIQYKVSTQALLSIGIVAAWSAYQYFIQGQASDVMTFFQNVQGPELLLIIPVFLWSGLVCNAAASVIQVGAVQAIGASRSQIIYATGPLWSAIMSMVVLGEKAGASAIAGGSLFMAAMFIAATAPPPESVCNDNGDQCEV